MSLEVVIKNAGKSYEVEVDLEETGLTFKNQIYSLTNIPPSRQKILLKGGQLKDDTLLSSLNLKPKQAIMVLGTPDEGLAKQVEKPMFIEDLSEDQLNVSVNEPSGLVNLGNTCYLNSSLQALFEIDDIKEKLKGYQPTTRIPGSPESFTNSIKSTFEQMSNKKKEIPPLLMLNALRINFPQFAEKSPQGYYKQQDAEEAFSQILATLRNTLKVDDLFKVEYKTKTNCISVDEEPVYGFEEGFKLNCHIKLDTNFLRDAITNGLKEELEKFNDTLQSNGKYEVTRTITRLPKYLTVHFVRFYWRRDTQKKSKILRKVQFPFELDLAEFLDESIKSQKTETRDAIRKIEKNKDESLRDFKKSKIQATTEKLTPFQIKEKDDAKIKAINDEFQENFKKILPESYDLGANENPSSLYELTSVITHQGSSADSGHYQCFVKDKSSLNDDLWWKFNDNKVTSVSRDKIEGLAGGGESDSALILIYKAYGL